MSKALLDSHDSTVEETAKFIGMVDKFFDCLNVTHINTGRKKKKSFQSPYRKLDDFRLKVYHTFCTQCNIFVHKYVVR